MKALICGNAPCFTEQVNDKDLSDYFIVRMNGFLSPPDLPCNAWSSWPDPYVRLKNKRHEPMYDVEKYAHDCTELWLCHPKILTMAINHFKRVPDYIMPKNQAALLGREVGSPPNMGMLMIRAAQLQDRFTEIYVAGFDHYEGPNDYYFIEGKFDHPAHVHEHNKIWFEDQISRGRIIQL